MTPLSGIVLEEGDSPRPAAGAIVKGQSFTSATHGYFNFETIADQDGRFHADRAIAPMAIYARTPDGDRAGYTTITPDATDVTLRIKAAPSVSGRLLDPDGEPLAHFNVTCRLRLQLNVQRADFWEMARTDAEGNFTVAGLIAGLECSLSASVRGSHPRRFQFEPLTVTGTDRIDLGTLVGKAPVPLRRRAPAQITVPKPR